MTLPILEYAALVPRAWKNGRGVTRILFDDADAADAWTWRISIAEITGTQPYSAYPGVHRGQVALGPGSADLVINGRAVTLAVDDVIAFDGEDEVAATPCEAGFLDLNVMTLRDTWDSTVQVIDAPTVSAEPGGPTVLIALDDLGTLDDRPLARLDAALLEPGTACTLRGRFVVARLRRI
ncbi:MULTISPECIES: HutD family protein [unclassified Microbacterium]|uniref:HutD family protein n=1 Tax=unclassified Microbacterium TaxID=2609290 RepID=UPI00365634B5